MWLTVIPKVLRGLAVGRWCGFPYQSIGWANMTLRKHVFLHCICANKHWQFLILNCLPVKWSKWCKLNSQMMAHLQLGLKHQFANSSDFFPFLLALDPDRLSPWKWLNGFKPEGPFLCRTQISNSLKRNDDCDPKSLEVIVNTLSPWCSELGDLEKGS